MPSETRFALAPARTLADLDAVAELFRAYVASLGIDLAYQDFEAELASLPGKYAPPGGELLLARDERGRPIGCVAMRPIPPEGCCEMKRMYVAPSGRRLGLGRALMNAIMEEATRAGYREMRLDTMPTLTHALALYRSGGFVTIPPYYETPIAETLFMARRLDPAAFEGPKI